MLSARSRLSATVAATSSTHTGWKRASAPASGKKGAIAAILANRVRKESPRPKITEGRNSVRSRPASRSAASPSALERR
jgi:hypothetical protein